MTSQPPSYAPQTPAGSPGASEPAFLAVGKLRRPHGVKGEIIMNVLTDFPERLCVGATLLVGPQHTPLRLRSRRPHGNTLLVAFDGYDTPEAVGELRNQAVYVPAAGRPALPEGEYYHHQLLGLRVVSDDGRALGILAEILETGANDVFVVRPESGPELLLPVIAPVFLGVDLANGEIHIHLLPGLLPEG